MNIVKSIENLNANNRYGVPRFHHIKNMLENKSMGFQKKFILSLIFLIHLYPRLSISQTYTVKYIKSVIIDTTFVFPKNEKVIKNIFSEYLVKGKEGAKKKNKIILKGCIGGTFGGCFGFFLEARLWIEIIPVGIRIE